MMKLFSKMHTEFNLHYILKKELHSFGNVYTVYEIKKLTKGCFVSFCLNIHVYIYAEKEIVIHMIFLKLSRNVTVTHNYGTDYSRF